MDGLASAMAVFPFKFRRGSDQRRLDVIDQRGPGAALLVPRGAQLFWVAIEQAFARQPEKPAGILVDVDKFTPVDVEHENRLGRVLDQRPVARLAFAHQLLGKLALSDIPDAHNEALAMAQLRLADRNFHGDPLTESRHAPGLVWPPVAGRIVALPGQALEETRHVVRINLGQHEIKRAAK